MTATIHEGRWPLATDIAGGVGGGEGFASRVVVYVAALLR